MLLFEGAQRIQIARNCRGRSQVLKLQDQQFFGIVSDPKRIIDDQCVWVDAFEKMRELFGQTSAPSMTVGELKLADLGVEELVPFLEEHGLARGE